MNKINKTLEIITTIINQKYEFLVSSYMGLINIVVSHDGC